MSATLWVSVREAAAKLGIHPKTVRRYIHDGHLHAAKVPGRAGKPYWIVREEDLLQLPVQYRKAPGNPSGPVTDATWHRFLQVLARVERGETWPLHSLLSRCAGPKKIAALEAAGAKVRARIKTLAVGMEMRR